MTGAVVTDWGGSNDHALGVKNGSTLEMPCPGGDSIRELMKAVQDGKISEADVDARLDEMLELVLSTHAAVEKAPRTFDAAAHHKLARRAAAESIVLLRNEGGILPLKPNEKLAVIGDFAETPRYQGAGSSAVNALQVDTLLDSIKADDSGITLVGYASGFERQGAADAEKLEEAVALAKKADTVLLCLGLDELRESEGLDRSDMKLAENQQQLLAAVAAVNPNVVVLLSAGAPIETPWAGQCRALVYGALGGQAGAGAAADILTGKLCPCGKLSQTWAQAHDDTPAKANFGGEGRILPEQHAPVFHIGAGDVHFQSGNAFLGGEDARQLRELSGGGGVQVGDDRRFMPRQAGQLALEEGFHAVVLQAHGIEHAAGGFRHAGQRIAGARLQGKPFDHDAAEVREIAVTGELDAVSERAGGRQDGVLEDKRPRVPGRLMG